MAFVSDLMQQQPKLADPIKIGISKPGQQTAIHDALVIPLTCMFRMPPKFDSILQPANLVKSYARNADAIKVDFKFPFHSDDSSCIVVIFAFVTGPQRCSVLPVRALLQETSSRLNMIS